MARVSYYQPHGQTKSEPLLLAPCFRNTQQPHDHTLHFSPPALLGRITHLVEASNVRWSASRALLLPVAVCETEFAKCMQDIIPINQMNSLCAANTCSKGPVPLFCGSTSVQLVTEASIGVTSQRQNDMN